MSFTSSLITSFRSLCAKLHILKEKKESDTPQTMDAVLLSSVDAHAKNPENPENPKNPEEPAQPVVEKTTVYRAEPEGKAFFPNAFLDTPLAKPSDEAVDADKQDARLFLDAMAKDMDTSAKGDVAKAPSFFPSIGEQCGLVREKESTVKERIAKDATSSQEALCVRDASIQKDRSAEPAKKETAQGKQSRKKKKGAGQEFGESTLQGSGKKISSQKGVDEQEGVKPVGSKAWKEGGASESALGTSLQGVVAEKNEAAQGKQSRKKKKGSWQEAGESKEASLQKSVDEQGGVKPACTKAWKEGGASESALGASLQGVVAEKNEAAQGKQSRKKKKGSWQEAGERKEASLQKNVDEQGDVESRSDAKDFLSESDAALFLAECDRLRRVPEQAVLTRKHAGLDGLSVSMPKKRLQAAYNAIEESIPRAKERGKKSVNEEAETQGAFRLLDRCPTLASLAEQSKAQLPSAKGRKQAQTTTDTNDTKLSEELLWQGQLKKVTKIAQKKRSARNAGGAWSTESGGVDESFAEWETFQAAMKDCRPLGGREKVAVQKTPKIPQAPEDSLAQLLENTFDFQLICRDEYLEGHIAALDAMTIAKLKAGGFSPEAHLDLHGCTVQEAYDALHAFTKDAWYKGLRTILIIPGRGHNSFGGRGILRSKLAHWLTEEPFKRVVLAFCTAQPFDGGPGSVYVLLRRYKKKGRVFWDLMPKDSDLRFDS